MESEKVKEIKELLRCMNGEKACTNCYINEVAEEQETFCMNVVADMTLELINELESENERLSKELDSEWKDRRKAEEDLHKAQWKYKIGLAQSRKRNKELKDRIAELENTDYYKEIENKKEDLLCKEYRLIKYEKESAGKYLKQFAERLKDRLRYTSPTSDVLELSGLEFDGIEVEQCIDETLKECL